MAATKTLTAARAFDEVLGHAEAIRNDAAHDLSGMEVGDEWPQGDVNVVRLPDDFARTHARRLVPVERPELQLAPGSTQGSRHCLDSLDGVRVYRLADATPLDGPVIETTEPRSIVHPEHGDVTNLPPGCYGITYQRAFATELRAVAD